MKLRQFKNAHQVKMNNRRVVVIDSPDGDGVFIETKLLDLSGKPTSSFSRRRNISKSVLRLSEQSAMALVTLLAIRMGISIENDVNSEKIHIYSCSPKKKEDR